MNAVTRWWDRRPDWQKDTMAAVGGLAVAGGLAAGAIVAAPALAPAIASMGGVSLIRAFGPNAAQFVARKASWGAAKGIAKGLTKLTNRSRSA